ncbi:hypothetical protein CEUSTIGMA_g13849.t1 [Chlamydomonas eustigma]|uniref:Reverse transcriptase domain-containing protein n=1 Tax=Chlamydomonas eustigma TaxID=1157962 RepID=A0A250XTY5_9CHLO|nr:hypothetical protein CEUSTIGMA_g13849.t1 [Chlamydomonas eustigma]|eukprot:GAX86439.1 hypothetical protein CEUSTIGMA_g13849.t1 [Chlamydomonas eustigma]
MVALQSLVVGQAQGTLMLMEAQLTEVQLISFKVATRQVIRRMGEAGTITIAVELLGDALQKFETEVTTRMGTAAESERSLDNIVRALGVAWAGQQQQRLLPFPRVPRLWAGQTEMRASWLQELLSKLRDPKDFIAGGLRERAAVWEEYFRKTESSGSKAVKEVIKWIREGIHWPMGEVERASQQTAPFHRKKVEIVRAMLQSSIPASESVDKYLEGSKPSKVQLPNHKSVKVYPEFVTKELEDMLKKKVVKEWAARETPVVINGLRVVDDKLPKLRLCINPMYCNLFWRYQRVQYERLSDASHLAGPGDFAFSTDDKSGYWQIPLHPAMWKYLAFTWEGRVYCFTLFTHLPFGVAPACFIYTRVKQELYRPLRKWGFRLVALIDDQLSLQKGEARTAFQASAMARLLEALGWSLSIPKCQLLPSQFLKFLGLMVDLKSQAFHVPLEKEAQLQSLIGALQKGVMVADRYDASLAGKVMALAPALELAPLVAWGLLKAMKGGGMWDEIYPSPAAFKADMELVLALLEAARGKGKPWKARVAAVRVVGHASETALAAYTPNGELEHPIVIPFTSLELVQVGDNEWSSTARELQVLVKVIQTLSEQSPSLLAGKKLLYCTDSQPGMQALMGMKGNARTYPIVKEARLLCWRMDTELEVIWRPREDAEQQEADRLSKVVDERDWVLNQEVYNNLLLHPSIQGRKPTMDAFALATNSKVPEAYYSLYQGPGCLGCDAFAHHWGEVRVVRGTGQSRGGLVGLGGSSSMFPTRHEGRSANSGSADALVPV